jgi:site-specific recombinase XerD
MTAPLPAPETPPTRRPVEILTAEEVKLLLRACSGRAPTGIRNRSLLALGWRGGLRLGEVLALFPKDLDREAGTVNVLRGKGGKQRTVGLDPAAFALVERWLDRRRDLGLNGRQPIICTLKGEPLLPSYVRTLMGRLGRTAGIEKRVHFHGLRHAHARELASENTPINVIQQQLGHSNVSTTHVYLCKIAPQQVIQTMQRREWAL